MTKSKSQLHEKWIFIGDIPLLFQTENVTKQMTVDIMFVNKDIPMVAKGVETVETMLNVLEDKMIRTPEQIKRDKETVRGYLV
jgi:hypothetical protein